MKKKVKYLTEQECLKAVDEYIQDCDCDELARIVGEFFGGECFHNCDKERYEFEPNEYYSGYFKE